MQLCSQKKGLFLIPIFCDCSIYEIRAIKEMYINKG